MYKPDIIEHISLNHYIILGTAIFIIGLLGVLVRKNIIIVFMCIELMLNGVNLILASTSTFYSDAGGQVMVFFTMAVAAAEVSVGLAIIVMMFKNLQSLNIDLFGRLKG
ncbi:MAG: NADH-quinone oxidoreductase subunit NuoK [Saprospiraceae bacterium]|jgi:NADH-quinone oxidoreductase subunit K|nr:NADH-quinone oxidoreductase subunit NuoK [Saprospiraceae bacterium]MBK7466482.1 NADH-quinone oxidoreductase subunit NuoK [Saprospiraceae bacterium]MBK9992797.1 NADH-quinone oxidoreductase subunit NuoK [Saprospiraceae bacterium]